MSRSGNFIVAISLLCVTHAAAAQKKDDADDFMSDVLGPIFGGNWNLFLHGGSTANGVFLLQRRTLGGERALRSTGSWNVGGGVGVDILKRTGLRASYTYSNGNLEWVTDEGTGSTALDVNNLASITTHVASAEMVHYMTPVRSSVAPYASLGLTGAWFTTDDASTTIFQSGGSTLFRWGGIASFGVQFHLGDGVYTQLEFASASLGNPFAGTRSFTAGGGTTIDEPRRVNKTDYRLVLVYRFGAGT